MKSPTKSLPKPARKQRGAVGRVMYCCAADYRGHRGTPEQPFECTERPSNFGHTFPVLLLPITDKEAFERAVEVATQGAYEHELIERLHTKWADVPAEEKNVMRGVTRAALAALGWSAPAAGKTGKEGDNL